ncbi:guanylate kinase [Clostridiales bacterium COT073_COT-073]|nr:guanylate kinase [Clostridiales bacterium COT073_COT-073]
MNKGHLYVISGFSGAGKGTVVKSLIDRIPDVALSVSATTRTPRQGEYYGKHYYFLDKHVFEDMITKNELYEYAVYLDNYYGTPKKFVQEQLSEGFDVILEIEMQGALQVKQAEPDAILIFIIPPRVETLRRRLLNRNTETLDVIHKRLEKSSIEVDQMIHYNYIVENDKLEVCVEDIIAIMRAEKIKKADKQKIMNRFHQEFDNILKGE